MPYEEKRITKSLVGALKLTPEMQNRIRIKLNAETAAQGLKSVGLAELTGWSTSKTSKVTAGKQTLSIEDMRMWARALGYTPDPFYEEGVDLRYYQASNYIRKFDEIMEDFLDADEMDNAYAAMAEYEMPLSLIMMLALKATDYVFRAAPGGWVNTPEAEGPTRVEFWPRGIAASGKPIPKMGVFFDERRDSWAIVVFVEPGQSGRKIAEIRQDCKEQLNIPDEETEMFDDNDIVDCSWLPEEVCAGEVSSYVSELGVLLAYKDMEEQFIRMFKQFCDVAYVTNGIDLIPAVVKKAQDNDYMIQGILFNSLMGDEGFDSDVEKQVREKYNYSCEIDSGHETFMTDENKPYMDVVALIPPIYGAKYGKAIKSAANAICICPNCKAKLLYGKRTEREMMVCALFQKHSDALRKVGIDISLRELLEAHQL